MDSDTKKIKDYSESGIGKDLVATDSLLNDFPFTDTIKFDQTNEGVPGQNLLFYGTPIRKKRYADDTTVGIWLGVDSDGKAKINIGTTTSYLKWNGTKLVILGSVEIDTGDLIFTDGGVTVVTLTTSYNGGTGIGDFKILTPDGTGLIIEADIGASAGGSTSLSGYAGTLHSTGSSSTGAVGFFRTDSATEYLQIMRGGGTTTLETDLALFAKVETATPAGGVLAYRMGTTAAFGIYYGSGAPSVSAAKGSLYLRSDGSGTTDRAYINTDGSTTWTAITTSA